VSAGLELDVRRRLGPFELRVELDAHEEIVVLYGHSGSGKSQTLRMVAGLTTPDSGHVSFAGVDWFRKDAGVSVRPSRRGLGYMLQQPLLFPHMSVAQNVMFGMPGSVDRRARARQLLEMLGLEGFEDRRPGTLSGGQQQRVALARALGRDARLLLLDEPFSALDEPLRAGLRRELVRLRNDLGLTILFVTHDLREAHLLGDRIAVFDAGRVLQFGPRDEVFRRPASRRVAELTGVANRWPGTVKEVGEGALVVDTGGVLLRSGQRTEGFRPGQQVDVLVRAERINLRRHTEDSGVNVLAAVIEEEFAYGNTHVLQLRADSPGPGMIQVEIAARPYEVLGVAARRRWLVEIPAEDIHIVPADAATLSVATMA
jgi:molybdate transport system ATP-binding protein